MSKEEDFNKLNNIDNIDNDFEKNVISNNEDESSFEQMNGEEEDEDDLLKSDSEEKEYIHKILLENIMQYFKELTRDNLLK